MCFNGQEVVTSVKGSPPDDTDFNCATKSRKKRIRPKASGYVENDYGQDEHHCGIMGKWELPKLNKLRAINE